MYKTTCMFLALALVLGLASVPVHAGEIDILLDKLVEKNVLTPLEASIIRDETKQQVIKDTQGGKSYAVPAWVQKTRIKGDLRLRYQYERRENDTEGRERGRIRYRLGFETEVNDQFKVGAGLASGGEGARSTNQTFGDLGGAFETPDIRLDYAYGEYKPMKGVKVVAGKFKRKPYLWVPTDLLWDGDINPEGTSINIVKSLTDEVEGFFNGGVWLLRHQDQVDMTDPFLAYSQAGIQWKSEKMDAKVAGTQYSFNGVQGQTQFDQNSSADTNTYTGGVYKYDYDSYAVGAEFGVKELFGGLPLKFDERIAVFGEYVQNFDPEEQNIGWIAGVKFGHKKVKKQGNWQFKYMYAVLGKDAWLDALPDSDRYDPGRTDVKSHEASIQYALKNNVILGLDYYNSDRIKSSKNRDQIIQADLLLKF
jgi:hypothetical protein